MRFPRLGHPLRRHAPTRRRGWVGNPETPAMVRAAEVGMRAVRRREELHWRPCHVRPGAEPMTIREVEVGAAGAQCLPPRTRCIELTDEWLRRHHGLVATVAWPARGERDRAVEVVLHAPEGDVRYREYRQDLPRRRYHLRRVDG